jgi:predicted lipoprotein with Yx(FWY)xxD motif
MPQPRAEALLTGPEGSDRLSAPVPGCMRRLSSLLAALAVAASVPAALADAHANRPDLKLRKTKAGTILVDSRGFTLYAFTADRRNHDACARIPGCLSAWPALTVTGRPVLGPGVRRGLVGTISVNGQRQLTYAGHPLYGYVGDRSPGQTYYINIMQFGGRWPAVNAAGNEVK